MSKGFKRIRTLMYNDQRFRQAELGLLHTPALQRLYDLHQLGLTDRVYIDASHSRLHHVVGVVEQANNLCEAVSENLRGATDHVFKVLDAQGAKIELNGDGLVELVRKRTSVIRLIGLLHDLTHAPYGHTIEDEIELIACKHDEPARQAEAFYGLICQYLGWLAKEAGYTLPSEIDSALRYPYQKPTANPEAVAEFGVKVLQRAQAEKPPGWDISAREVAELIGELLCAMTALLHLELLHTRKLEQKFFPQPEYEFQRTLRVILSAVAPERLQDCEFIPRRDAFMLDLIGNTVCADLLDYAQRDATFANLKMGYDAARIAENFTLVVWNACTYSGAGSKDRRETVKSDPFGGDCIRTAISLFSHKLRTDVPSELMNLLNVRFYLYERVLYHPTKSAAGAMLGTSIQLLGLQSSGGTDTDGGVVALPEVMRYLGDSVFLDRVYHGARLALQATRECLITTQGVDASPVGDDWTVAALGALRSKIDSPELEIARAIVARWQGRSAADAIAYIDAGSELLCRLTSRRYFKQVFRNLPNAHNKFVDKKSEDLATHFLNASVRYTVERSIEVAAELRAGSVVIHCPRINTAQKIANVLLVLPEDDGTRGEVRKLRDVGELDADVFGSHQVAINAVENMYRSMWRLSVCVAPEYLDRWEKIAEVAGKVIFREFDSTNEYPSQQWENDRHLTRELRQKYGSRQVKEKEQGGRVTEVDKLVACGVLDSVAAEEQVRRAVRPQALLGIVLPAVGKERLDRREDKLFNEFIEQHVMPMEPDRFVEWVGTVKSEFLPEQPDLPLDTARHFKAGDITAILDRLKETLSDARPKAKSGA